jgi:HSP20 family protein
MLLPSFSRFGLDPFSEMRRLQNDMNRLFSGYTQAAGQEFPPINLWLGDNSVVVTAELPGVSPQDVDLTVHDETLTIRGKVEPKLPEGQNVAWHRRERRYGEFVRTIQLPFRVDAEGVQARFNNGVLEIEMQRPHTDLPRKIQIRAGA